jgi:DNA polymerase III subunit gamma/tau
LISLPLKHRPQAFEDIVGQPLLVRYLKNLCKKKIGKNIILYGQYGGGKTSTARIYAKSLNCLSPVDGSPCYTCESCKEDLTLEIDATTAGSKDNISTILEMAKTPPLFGKYRVIVFDEVQNLSKSAWDSLLKPIEEPKDFQVFIFSTTELEKVRPAVRSRCQLLEFKNISDTISFEYLKSICNKESFQYEETALQMISHFSKGCLRDLVKNLEQVSHMGDNITVENTAIIFNLGFLTPLVKMFCSVMDRETKTFKKQIADFVESPKRISELLKQFALFLFYKYIRGVDEETNPAFSLIPAKDLNGIWNIVQKCFDCDVDSKYTNFLNGLNSIKDNSSISLEISLLGIHDEIHNKKVVGATRMEKSSETSEEPVRRRKWKSLEKEKKVEPVEIVQKAPEEVKEDDTVYSHNLLSTGFVAEEVNDSDLVIVE